VLQSGQVIDQSLDIMYWALQRHDADGWLRADPQQQRQLIAENDGAFKQWLDRYKYAIRFPEHAAEYYRQQGELFLQKLEQCLQQSAFLLGNTISMTDIAIFPFIRQFAAVDSVWFETASYLRLKLWLQQLVGSALFESVMAKYPSYTD